MKTLPKIRHLTFSRSLTSTDSSFHLTICYSCPMRSIWDMLHQYPFHHLLCRFIHSAKILGILKRALNNISKFSKYFSTFWSPNFETPWLNVPIKRPLQRNSLFYVWAENQLNSLISSTSYVMDNAQLCLGRTKKKMKWNQKSKNLALLGLAVQVEYLSNLDS